MTKKEILIVENIILTLELLHYDTYSSELTEILEKYRNVEAT